jgi:hypothetical protein
MFKYKNITNHQVSFVDTEGIEVIVPPGEEIEHVNATNYGYVGRLEIEEIKEQKTKKKEKENSKEVI